MAGIVDIDVNQIPFNFDISLSGKIYNIALRYNVIFDFFTVDLKLNNTILVQNEKLVLDQFLFREVYEDNDHNLDPNFPSDELLYVGCEDNKIKRVSLDNLGDTVNIYVIDRKELTSNV